MLHCNALVHHWQGQRRGRRRKNISLCILYHRSYSFLFMSSSGSSTTWLSVLEETKQAVNAAFGPGYGLPGTVCSERSFRAALEAADTTRKKHKVSRLDAKLLPTYEFITDLAQAVDESTTDLQGLPPNDGLEPLVWWTSFDLIKASCRAPVLNVADKLKERMESRRRSRRPRIASCQSQQKGPTVRH